MVRLKLARTGFPYRHLVARVTRAEPTGPREDARVSFEFDAIDSTAPADGLHDLLSGADTKPFAAIRVIARTDRFRDAFKFVPAEGMWVELSIRPGRSWPVAYHSQLEEDGYAQQTRGSLDFAREIRVPEKLKVRLTPLGATTAPSTKLAVALAREAFPKKGIVSAKRVRAAMAVLTGARTILVRDVGQASFASIMDRSDKPLIHFDAGWPISFNGHTCPSSAPVIRGDAPVVLSHWDWDHLHGFYKCSTLRAVPWIVPVQPLGPGALRVAKQLARSGLLMGYRGKPIATGNWALVPCSGASRMNDNGLALVLTLERGKRALLVGDASYSSLPPPWRWDCYDLLVVTHHGADFENTPARPRSGRGLGVISVGEGNVYRHPRDTALAKHRQVGWTLRRTAAYRGIARGDRSLGN